MRLRMADTQDTKRWQEETANRLRLTRLSFGHNQMKFAEQCGISQSQYNQLENGSKLMAIQTAMKIVETYKVSLDWLYLGEPSNLSVSRWRAIRAAEETGASDE